MTEFKSGEGEPGLGGCITEALSQAGYGEIELPEWVRAEDMPNICEELGLKYHHGEDMVWVEGDRKMIGIYETRPGKAHAELVDNIGRLVKEKRRFIGIIELPDS